MVSRVSIPGTAQQSPTLVPRILVLWNDSYAHEYLEISLHMLQDGINHWSFFGIAQLLILAYLHQFLGEMACQSQQKPAQEP